MKIEGSAKAAAIYIGESDQWHGKPLYAEIVRRAREAGLAGATVTRGIMGFGANTRIHSAHLLSLSDDLPICIQLVDLPERLIPFVDSLDSLVTEGLVMTWDVNVERYVHSKGEE